MAESVVASQPPGQVLVSATLVEAAVIRLAAAVQSEIDDAPGRCLLLGVLLGGLLPLARITARLHGDFLLDSCRLSRYREHTSGGELQMLCPPVLPLSGHTVILVDDIFDQGLTLEHAIRYCRTAGAARVLSVVLVQKRHQRQLTDCRPDHVGLWVDDHFVFGAGMDYRGGWRQLPDIWALAQAEAAR